MKKQWSTPILAKNAVPIDLSCSNPDLKQINVSSSAEWMVYIDRYLSYHKADMVYGGYLEKRSIYDRSTHFSTQSEVRNIHLGVDMWAKSGTSIRAPWKGKIHSFQNNTNFGDYGPTIILEHMIKNKKWYSLFGHLSLDSLVGKYVGQEIKEGEEFAALGEANENGDYAPHLHFQIILDMQGLIGDYPGVCSSKNLEFYTKNCPNPTFYLKGKKI